MTNAPRRPTPAHKPRRAGRGAEATLDLIVPRSRPRLPEPVLPASAQAGSDDLPPLLLSTAEVAKRFRRSPRTLRRWAERGHLLPVRVGDAVFFRDDDVRQLVGTRLSDTAAARVGVRPRRRETEINTDNKESR